MAGTIDRTPCPGCGQTEVLYISVKLFAKKIGEFSLAGAQVKFSARELPVLKCHNCDFNLVGRFTDDNHVAFTPPKGDS